MKIEIHYQTERKPKDDCIYYPEDFKTPKQRIDYIAALSKTWGNDKLVVVTACPYITKAIVANFNKLSRQTGIEIEEFYFIDNKACELNDIFKYYAEAMNNLMAL